MAILLHVVKWFTLLIAVYGLYKSFPLYLRWIFKHWPYALLIGFLLAMVMGFVGSSFGIANLFWAESPKQQLLAGFSVGALVGLLFWMIYTLEEPEGRGRLDEQVAHSLDCRRLWPFASHPSSDSPDPPDHAADSSCRLWVSSVLFPLLFLLMLPAAGWIYPPASAGPSKLHDHFSLAWLPLGFALALALVLVAPAIGRRRSWLAGRLSFIVVTLACLALVWFAAWQFDPLARWITAPVALCWTLAALVLLVFVTRADVLPTCTFSIRSRAFSIRARAFSIFCRIAIVTAVVVLIAVHNGSDPFKLQYPGLDDHYPAWSAWIGGEVTLPSLDPKTAKSSPTTKQGPAAPVVAPRSPTEALDVKIARTPEVPDLYRQRGLERLRHGLVDLAVKDLKTATQLAPQSGPCAAALGAALCLDGEADQAIEALNRAISLGADSPVVRFNLGSALAIKLDYSSAREAYKLAESKLQLLPNNDELRSLVNLFEGTLSLYERDYNAAITRFSTSTKLNKTDPFPIFFQGLVRELQNDLPVATELFKESVTIASDFAPVAWWAYHSMGHVTDMAPNISLFSHIRFTQVLSSEYEGRYTIRSIGAELIAFPVMRSRLLTMRWEFANGLQDKKQVQGPGAIGMDLIDKAKQCDPASAFPYMALASWGSGNAFAPELRPQSPDDVAQLYREALKLEPDLLHAKIHLFQILLNSLPPWDMEPLKRLDEETRDVTARYPSFCILRGQLFQALAEFTVSEARRSRPTTSPLPREAQEEADQLFKKCLQEFDAAARLAAGASEPHLNKATLYMGFLANSYTPKFLDSAEDLPGLIKQSLDAAREADPTSQVVYQMLTDFHRAQGEFEEATRANRIATKLISRFSDVDELQANLFISDAQKPSHKSVDDLAALEAWLKMVQPDPTRPKPKLVVVAVSGGGIAASYWAARCLAEIERAAPAFPRHLRLVSGASGGMLGAASYVASLALDLVKGNTRIDDFNKTKEELQDLIQLTATQNLPGNRFRSLTDAMASESLGPAVQRMLLFDLPSIICPMRQKNDRGCSLEKAWIASTDDTLGWPLSALASAEGSGVLPSLVFTPISERGAFLLVSNLYLNDLALGRDFFELFPKSRDKLTLATAVRMNATFPLLTPAVSLPTRDADRVGDAGYLDNYGIWVSSQWIQKNRAWLTSRTSGIILIQIRTYKTVPKLRTKSWPERFTNGMQWLTSPLDLASSVRYSMMDSRNEQSIEDLRSYFNIEGIEPFFHYFLFESDYPNVPLSWSMTGADRERLDAEFRDSPLDKTLDPEQAGALKQQRLQNKHQLKAIRDLLPSDLHNPPG